MASKGKVDANKAKDLFFWSKVKFSLTKPHNKEANSKVDLGHSAIMKAFVVAKAN